MVAASTIVKANASLTKERRISAVCVFVGATAGIGMATLNKTAALLYSSTFYILGRSPSRYKSLFDQLKEIGPTNTYNFIEAQVSLISSIDAACTQITSAEAKVDYVFMSPGGVPWQGAVYTAEGIETCFAVSYFSRLRIVSNLLPLLHRSPQPHVLSILNGTKEKAIDEQDLACEKQWGLIATINHTTLFNSLAFDYLAEHDTQMHIVFLHATPGLVYTGSPKQEPVKADGWFRYVLLSFLKFLSHNVVKWFGMSLQESGERHAFELINDTFKPGSWRVTKESDVVPENAILIGYQERGRAEKIWEFTQSVWDKASATT